MTINAPPGHPGGAFSYPPIATGRDAAIVKQRDGRQAIRRGIFTPVKDLNTKIRQLITGWNDRKYPFVWTKTSEEILTKANRQPTVRNTALVKRNGLFPTGETPHMEETLDECPVSRPTVVIKQPGSLTNSPPQPQRLDWLRERARLSRSISVVNDPQVVDKIMPAALERSVSSTT